MTLTNTSRKRECSDDFEYLPVTKRMNNLHIDVVSVGSNELNESLIGRQMKRCDQRVDQNQSHSHSVNAINAQNCVQNRFDCLSVYSPELDSNSNPIYYESNRILFEAHLQRLHRIGSNGRQAFDRKS